MEDDSKHTEELDKRERTSTAVGTTTNDASRRKRKTVKRYGITDNDHESDLARRKKELVNQGEHPTVRTATAEAASVASKNANAPTAIARKKQRVAPQNPPAHAPPTVVMARNKQRVSVGEDSMSKAWKPNQQKLPKANAFLVGPPQKAHAPTVNAPKKYCVGHDSMFQAWTTVKAFMDQQNINLKYKKKKATPISDAQVKWICDMLRPFPHLWTQPELWLYTPLLFLLEHKASLAAIQGFCQAFPKVLESFRVRDFLFRSHRDIIREVQPAIREFLDHSLPRRVPPQTMEAAMEYLSEWPTEYTLEDLQQSATVERQSGLVRNGKIGQERLLRCALFHRVYEHHPNVMEWILDQYGSNLTSFSVDADPSVPPSLRMESDKWRRPPIRRPSPTSLITMDLNRTVAQLVQRLPRLVNLQVEIYWTIQDRRSWGNLLQTLVTASPSLESLSMSFWPEKRRTVGPGRPPAMDSVLPERIPRWVWGELCHKIIGGSMPNLKHLTLDRNEKLDQGSNKEDGITNALARLLSGDRHNNKLEGLFVNHFHMDHHVIIEALKTNTSLKYFGIDTCSDTGEKQAALVEMLQHNTSLHNVVLPLLSSKPTNYVSTTRRQIANFCALNQMGCHVYCKETSRRELADLMYTKALHVERFLDGVLREPKCIYRGPQRRNTQPSDSSVAEMAEEDDDEEAADLKEHDNDACALERLSYSYSLLRECPKSWSNDSLPIPTGAAAAAAKATVAVAQTDGSVASGKSMPSLRAKKRQSSSVDQVRLITPQSFGSTKK